MSKTDASQLDREVEAQRVSAEHIYDISDKTGAVYNKEGAIEAENVEHNMTVLQAVRAYPMATWWAFVMSCTIVSCLSRRSDFTSAVEA